MSRKVADPSSEGYVLVQHRDAAEPSSESEEPSHVPLPESIEHDETVIAPAASGDWQVRVGRASARAKAPTSVRRVALGASPPKLSRALCTVQDHPSDHSFMSYVNKAVCGIMVRSGDGVSGDARAPPCARASSCRRDEKCRNGFIKPTLTGVVSPPHCSPC